MEVGIDDLVRKMSASRSGSTVTAASRPGAWRCRGPAFRWRSSSNWRSRCPRRNTCAWKPSSTSRWRPARRSPGFPWPYVEGLTMAEATNELAFIATGAYGKPIAKQHGAPIRLAVPWKYGFKSIKSIVRFSLHRQAAEELLGRSATPRVRLLGERQSGGSASALEPGERRTDRHRRAPADAAVQRLRRLCRRPLQGPRKRAAVGVTTRRRG